MSVSIPSSVTNETVRNLRKTQKSQKNENPQTKKLQKKLIKTHKKIIINYSNFDS